MKGKKLYHPTTRLLTILELLQSRGEMSGHELAHILEVEERSVRRYILMLRDMGIPIEGERGRHGGYWLRPGFRLPPLMFNPDEITAVVLGLKLLHEFGYTSLAAIESTSAKIQRVLPEELRDRIEALRESLTMNQVQLGTRHISNEQISLFSLAIHEGKCLQITYVSGEGHETQRMITPYGLVLHAKTWYIPAYCYLRENMRIFRLDRIRSVVQTDQTSPRPADFDAMAFVLSTLAQTPGVYTFEVLLHAPFDVVRDYIPADMAILESAGDKTLMRCYSDDPHWLARYLARLELRFTIQETEELRIAVRALAGDLLASV
jgi:predicted DNA-binding transcriptional regulator YafY